MYYGTIILVYHPRRKKAVRNQIPVKAISCRNLSSRNHQTTYLMIENQNQCTRCGDSPHAQGFYCPSKKYQCKHCTEIGHFMKMYFTKNAHPQPQHYYKGKQKQAHQIIVPEHSTKQYKNTCECDNDNDFMIAFQLHAQPQKNVHH